MRVVLTHYITNDTSTFNKFCRRAVTVLIHRVKNTSVYWLKTVTHIWQCTINNDTHRVAKETVLHDVFERPSFKPWCEHLSIYDMAVFICCIYHFVFHTIRLTPLNRLLLLEL